MINQAAHDGSSRSDTSEWVAGIKKTGKDVRLYVCFLAHPASFLFRVSLQHPLVPSLLSRGNHFKPSMRLVWAQNQPNQQTPGVLRVYLNEKPRSGYTWKIPGKFSGFLDFASDFATARPALRLRETRESLSVGKS